MLSPSALSGCQLNSGTPAGGLSVWAHLQMWAGESQFQPWQKYGVGGSSNASSLKSTSLIWPQALKARRLGRQGQRRRQQTYCPLLRKGNFPRAGKDSPRSYGRSDASLVLGPRHPGTCLQLSPAPPQGVNFLPPSPDLQESKQGTELS